MRSSGEHRRRVVRVRVRGAHPGPRETAGIGGRATHGGRARGPKGTGLSQSPHTASLSAHETDTFFFIAQHCQTNQCLAVPGFSFPNDFGHEFEVCGHTFVSAGNAYVMRGLATGKPTSMTTKVPGDVNTFVVVLGEAR